MTGLHWAAVLVVLLGATRLWHGNLATVLPRVPAERAEPWMADSLPGVGPKSREAVADAIRRADLAGVPTSAQATARELFSGLP